jgi:hypothetical protein
MNYVIDRVSDSGTPLLDLQETKEYLKVKHSLEDQTITNLIERVINDMEGYMWTSLQSSVYKVYVDSWNRGCIHLRRGPVNAISEVKYYDETNSEQTLAANQYFLSRGVPDRFMKEYNVTLPPIYPRPDAIQIQYSTSPLVESKVKSRALKAIGFLYENRNNIEVSMTDLYKAIVQGARRNHL